jgi:hypothetical protein
MPWINVGTIVSSRDWQFSQAVQGSLFRVQHHLTETPPYGFKGLIAQATFGSRGVEFFEIRKIFPKFQLDIFEFTIPPCFEKRVIAVKGQQRYLTKIQWSITIDVWEVR